VVVIHGSSDATVAPINGRQVISQYATTLDLVLGKGTASKYITDVPTSTANFTVPGTGGRQYTVSKYDNTQDKRTLIQFISVNGMGHAWSGGNVSGSYTDPKGPDASQFLVDYFFSFTNGATTSSSTGSTTTSSTTATTSTSATVTTGSSIATSTTTTTSTTSTTTGGTKIAVLTSITGEDGYVGKLLADGYSTTVCKAGDKGMFNSDDYRAILSFATNSIPQNAKVQSAVLKITRQTLSGSLRPLIVDIKSGTFGPSTQLTLSSYNAAATLSDIGRVPIPASDNADSTLSLPANALQYTLGTNGRIQFRLRQDASAATTFAANTLQMYPPRSLEYHVLDSKV